ncbi:MAG: DoxX family protein [Campylobacterales bacterium]|nr:DoxX family protein [Campylobacterales bacterium]
MQCQLSNLCKIVEPAVEKLQSVALLFVRLILAYGFYEPAKMKWNDIGSVAEWFASMGLPMPTLQAYLAATTEAVGVVLLTLGLFTRLISIPLMGVMLVAITLVHLPNGFQSGNNGFEIPLYYFIMLFVLLTHGAGNLSFDRLLFKSKEA